MKTITKRDVDRIVEILAATCGTMQQDCKEVGELMELAIVYDTTREPGVAGAWRVVKRDVYLEDAEECANFSARAGEPYRDTRDRVADAVSEMLTTLPIEEV